MTRPKKGPQNKTPNRTPWTKERLQARANIDAGTGCWNWPKPCKDGYARYGGTSVHKIAYMVFIGPVPTGLTIDHTCRNKACFNPDHLEAVTDHENRRRGNVPSYVNGTKTHCNRGHPLSGENLKVGAERRRVCRTCARAAYKAANLRKKLARESARVL